MWLYKGIQYIVTPPCKHTFYMRPTAWLYEGMTVLVYKEIMVGMIGDIKNILQVMLKVIQSFKSDNFLLGKMVLKKDAVFSQSFRFDNI